MRIIVGVDGSLGAQGALDWAMEEARLRRCPVTALLAYGFYGRPDEVQAAAGGFGPEELERAAREVLAKSTVAALAAPGGAALQEQVSAEEPVKALLDAVQADDLLVLGARGLGAMRRFLLGSVSIHCVNHADSPVVVVRSHPASHSRSRVVVGLDGSDESVGALRWGAEHARARGLPLEVVRAWSLLTGPAESVSEIINAPGERERAAAEAERLVEENVPAQLRSSTRVQVVDGQPAPVLIEAGEEAELLVMGSRGRGGFARLTLGSTSSACTLHAPCNVAVVPGASRVEALL
jgi:nucleotide-binding universal stress UspA family protein